MRHSFIDRYSYLESPLHRLNASVKVGFALVVLIYLVAVPWRYAQWTYPLYLLFLMFMIILSRVPFAYVLKRIMFILPFLIFVLLLNALFKKNGFHTGCYILLRTFLSVATLVLLVSITRFSVILHTLSAWHVPKIILLILAFMYRYFFVLVEEAERMIRAVKLRSSMKKRSEFASLFSHVIGILFIRSYERAERVYNAMVMRGFDGDVDRL
jgi:cobalt/nickel transport system permease protein